MDFEKLSKDSTGTGEAFERLVEIIRYLRSEEGCPWDKVQTHESLKKCLIEESYEVIDAIDKKDKDSLEEELGDLILQGVFHGLIAEDEKNFDLISILNRVSNKMIFRHPHVFGNAEGDALDIWEKAKREEKGQKTTAEAMRAVARTLPALWRAQKIQKKAAGAGFKWPDVESAVDKIAEETDELRQSIQAGELEHIEEELGDLLLAAVNTAGYFGIDPERALNKACDKYVHRFECMESEATHDGRIFSELSLDEMLEYYKRAKME